MTSTEVVENPGDADLVISELIEPSRDGNHMPVIDLDVPCALVPSATPGNWHLYIEALVDARVVQPGYLQASRERRFTSVRVPWKPKGVES